MNIWIIYDKLRLVVNRDFASMLLDACRRNDCHAEVMLAEDIISGELLRTADSVEMSEHRVSNIDTYSECVGDTVEPQGRELANFSQADDIISPLCLPDAAIMRTDNLEISTILEMRGVRVYNSAEISRLANDKWLTYQYAADIGLNLMRTMLVSESDEGNITCISLARNGSTRDKSDAKNLYISEVPLIANDDACDASDMNNKKVTSRMNFPLVVKSRRGHGGKEVFLVHSVEDIKQALRTINQKDAIIQQLASDAGRDLRCYVINNRLVCAMLRQSCGDFRSNYSLGGSATKYELSVAETAILTQACGNLRLDMVGVDFIFHDGEMIFNEIEDVVGCRMVYASTNIDLVDIYIKHIVTDRRIR